MSQSAEVAGYTVFREALSRHYKAERERSEACLADIVEILKHQTRPHSETIDAILLRLIHHYERT